VGEKQWEEREGGGGANGSNPNRPYNDSHDWSMHMLHHTGTEKAPFNAVNASFGTKELIRMQICV